MTAALHLQQAVAESQRLDAEIESLIQMTRIGGAVNAADLSHLRRLGAAIRNHAARADHDFARTPLVDRRPNLVGGAATGDEALERGRRLHEALVASTEKLIEEADLVLDQRPSFLYAKSVAHTACVQSREVLPAAEKLHGPLWLPELEASHD